MFKFVCLCAYMHVCVRLCVDTCVLKCIFLCVEDVRAYNRLTVFFLTPRLFRSAVFTLGIVEHEAGFNTTA